MNLVGPALRQLLTRARLVADGVNATSGVGERKSRVKGEGIEFEDHREYQPGDDFRRLDPHLYARFGEAYVRQYNVGQQLTVTLLLDSSASMAFGTPSKLAFAVGIATGLSVAALAGSDGVQGAVLLGGTASWHPRVSGLGRLDTIERWLAAMRPAGSTDLATAIGSLSERLTRPGICILLSDLWSEALPEALDLLARLRQTPVIFHVLAPEELDPALLGSGAMQLADVETGDEAEVTIGPSQAARYRALLSQWVEAARGRVLRQGGTFTTLSSDTPMNEVFMRVLPGLGVLR